MEHLILTETEFFRLIDNPGSRTGLNAAYNEFTMAVVSLCTGAASPCHPLPALSYAETELQYHKALQDADTDHGVYVRKALSFVRKMLKHLSLPHSQVPPLSLHSQVPPLSFIPSKDEKKDDTPADAPPMRWTGKASDLVELIYGVSEMGCINGGEASLKEIAAYFYKVFGVQAKGCYNIFGDIKMRKNESRTYFLDRAAEKVNRRMLLDEERERQRR